MTTFSKRAYVIPKSAAPRAPVPLLTHTSTGDAQTQFCLSLCGGPWVLVCTRFVCTFREFLVGMRFDSKSDCTSPTVLLGLLFCPQTWGISFWWDPTSSCQRLFSSKLRFWCFAGEDQRMSFYSANMLDTSISTAMLKQPPQHILTAASPLLVPGIFAGASVSRSQPALQAEAC